MSKGIVYDYVVVLKNNNKIVIEKTGWLLSFLSFLPIGISFYQDPRSFIHYLLLFVVLSLLICIGIGLISIAGYFMLGMLYVIAGISEKFLAANVEIGFSENTIVKTGWVNKKYSWSELNNVVIKDDLLTMDFKNNTLLQAYTDDEEDEEYDVVDEEFNQYCKRQLTVAR